MGVSFLVSADQPHRPYLDYLEHFAGAPSKDDIAFMDDRRGVLESTCSGKGLRWRLGEAVGEGWIEVVDLGLGTLFAYYDTVRTNDFTFRTRSDDSVSLSLVSEIHAVDPDFEFVSEEPQSWIISHGSDVRLALKVKAGVPSRGVVLEVPRTIENSLLGVPFSSLPAVVRDTILSSNKKLVWTKAAVPRRSSNILNDVLGCHYKAHARFEFMRAKAIELLSHIINSFENEVEQPRTVYRLSRSDISQLDEARRYLDARMDAPPTLTELALLVGMSRSKFAEMFKSHFGVTVHDYSKALRMEKAKSILEKSDTPISEIAQQLGYCNSSYFARVFAAHYGRTPTDVRKS